MFHNNTAFVSATFGKPPLTRRRLHRSAVCSAAAVPPSSPPSLPDRTSARGATARRLAQWLAADWSNLQQALDNPPIWAHVRVCYRPLPWHFLNGYAFYTESAYDYDISLPYKTSVVHIVADPDGTLELQSYKITEPDEFWMGAHEPQLLEPLKSSMIKSVPNACNIVVKWNENKQTFNCVTTPGKQCCIQRKKLNEPVSYLDSTITLTKDYYSPWDLGRSFDTDEIIWGSLGGPYMFVPKARLDHLVPNEEDVAVEQSPKTTSAQSS